MPTVLIAGGTGLVGRRLSALLVSQGYAVRILTRTLRSHPSFAYFYWDPEKGVIDEQCLVGVDAVINLAGENIAEKRWSAARKKSIIASRIEAARLLGRTAARLHHAAKVYISASAIGYYGDTGDAWQTETDGPAPGDFTSAVCQEWEKEAQAAAAQLQARAVILRIGIVMDAGGGALKEMARSLSVGVSVQFGAGKMWVSWIHADDLCQMIVHCVKNTDVSGIYNAVAPNPVTNAVLSSTLLKNSKNKLFKMPIPIVFLRLMLGELSTAILASTRVSCAKIEKTGFKFTFSVLEPAVAALIL